MQLQIARKRVLVTGATGYLGPPLCRRLSEAGAEVYAVSRRAREGRRDGVEWRRGDMAEPATARRLLEEAEPDVVFHLAGLASGARSPELVLPTYHSNLTTTVALLTAAAETDCRRIVLAGSMEEPGTGNGEIVPSSPYAASKWAASAYGRMFHALFDTPVTIARIFMVYGPGQQDERKLLPYVIRSLLQGEPPRLADGERRIDWIYMDDVADGLIRLAVTPDLEGETVDIGTGRLVSVREIVERLTEIVGGSTQPEFGAVPPRPMEQVRVADANETYERIGWRAAVGLEEGLRRTLEWYAGRLNATRAG